MRLRKTVSACEIQRGDIAQRSKQTVDKFEVLHQEERATLLILRLPLGLLPGVLPMRCGIIFSKHRFARIATFLERARAAPGDTATA